LLKHADNDDAEPFIPRRGLCKAIAVMGAQNVEDFIELMTMERLTDEIEYEKNPHAFDNDLNEWSFTIDTPKLDITRINRFAKWMKLKWPEHLGRGRQ
jgi:hypothetical protein